jgi:site-specific recombinase XerD
MSAEVDTKSYHELSSNLLRQIESLGYDSKTVMGYQRTLNGIAAYLTETEANDYYTAEIGAQYIVGCVERTVSYISPVLLAETVVRRLNDLLTGEIHFYRHSNESPKCPEAFIKLFSHYIEHMRLHGNKASTIKNRERYCVQFLRAIEKAGVLKLVDIRPRHIYDAFAASNSKGNFRQAVVPFLKYLFTERIQKDDLSECVPHVRRPQPMPSTYSEAEIAKLLAEVDPTAPNGKRDYAILIIASQLGLRASDICALSMGNIDLQTKTIRLAQQKTGAAMRMALLPSVEEALLAYVDTARPTSDSDKIFLRRRAPYSPLRPGAVYEIVRHHLCAAGIDSSGKKRGPHSLRMSLATKLLSENVPYAAVQKILGHEDPQSTKHYARMDSEMLRQCALETPLPTGLFADRLGISRKDVR